MNMERRIKEKQTREFMMGLLNDEQQEVVAQYEMFDWFLIFVRRPTPESAIPFLKNTDTGRFAILESDGSLNEDQDLVIRE
jgi:hypothetical protein